MSKRKEYSCVLVDTDAEGITWITFNRPEKRNAMSPTLHVEMEEILYGLETDAETKVVVLTGAGNSWSAGMDLKQYFRETDNDPAARFRAATAHRRWATELLTWSRKPTIAMVNGVAVGGGFDLACACDLRTGSENSRFMVAFTRIGLFPGWGGTWLYSRIIGIPKAAEMLFTGDFLEAKDAERFGLLNNLVPAAELEKETMNLARRIANGPPIAIRLAKMQLYKGLEMDLETAMQVAAACETITLTSEDHKEGVAAFREKRPPQYKGK